MSRSVANAERAAFDLEVDCHVRLALERGADGVAELLEALPSIDPLAVQGALRRIGKREPRAAGLLQAIHKAVAPVTSQQPIAHPLEFDWRFTPETAGGLAARVAADTSAGESILYLGAPTVFDLASSRFSDRHHTLLDMSRRRLPVRRPGADVYPVDLLDDELPVLRPAAAAIADPPWYPEHMTAFLHAASSLLAAGGSVIASFPPLLTRPGAAAERARILQESVRAGLVVTDVQPLILRYRTPPFERAAFAAAGVGGVPDAWRRGDMLVLSKEREPAPRPAVAIKQERWIFFEIDEIPIAVHGSAAAARCVPTRLLEARGTLASVSRRDPARRDAVLWSSRNRIYRSAAPALVAEVTAALATKADPVVAVESLLGRSIGAAEQEAVSAATNQLSDLVRLERQEHGLE